MKHLRPKLFSSIVLSISLILITAAIGYASEPPPGFTISGPPVVGVLTLENQRDDAGNELGWITVTFRGFCKIEYVKKKLCYFTFPSQITSFADITQALLLNYVLQWEGPSDCYSECGGEDIIITKVLKFKKAGDKITADVIFKFLIPM